MENQIVSRKWSDDGRRIIFMLETNQFLFARELEEIQVVEIDPGVGEELLGSIRAKDAERMGARPMPYANCAPAAVGATCRRTLVERVLYRRDGTHSVGSAPVEGPEMPDGACWNMCEGVGR